MVDPLSLNFRMFYSNFSGCQKIEELHISLVMRKPTFWFLTWSNTNQAVQLQKMALGVKFQI